MAEFQIACSARGAKARRASSCLIAIGLLGGVAQAAVTEAYRLAPVSLIAPFEYTALLVAAVFGYALWGQVPDRFVWLGAAIVAASSLYIAHREAVRRGQAD